jgi:sialate O-acetylesterase
MNEGLSMKKQTKRMIFVLCACAVQWVNAGVWLPAIFGDHMVLQAEKPIHVWGKADPGETVTVEFAPSTGSGQAGQKKSTVADGSKHWKVTFDPVPASSKPWKMVVSSPRNSELETLNFSNVLIGEVWLCAGQSNMRWRMDRTQNAEAEMAAADHPGIRLFLTEQMAAGQPLGNLKGQWKICSPETVGEFSGAGYYFGRDLHQELKVPVGLICSAVGGTPVQAWTPQEVMDANPLTAHIQKDYKAYYDTPAAQRRKARGTWIYGAKAEKGPARLFNAMISPLIPLTIRGATWCQGEANDRENGMWDGPSVYSTHFPMMIQAWRDQWGQGDFPFIYIELANYMTPQTSPVDVEAEVHWGPIREAQSAALALTNVYAVSVIDLGVADNIHYQDKQTVGRRLMLAATGQVYKKAPAPSLSPRYASYSIAGSQVHIQLHDAAGLHTDDGKAPHAFAVRGEDGDWKWAEVSIAGEELIVSHPEIVKPVAVRHAWASNPDVNVYNSAGLPLMPFRTDADVEGAE